MKKSNGFSLIELMIVVAIVAILARIALPGYQSYILKSHRTAAINAVLDLASREARFYTTNNTYTNNMTNLGYSTAGSVPVPATGTTYYTLSTTGGTTFTVTATPAGTQVNDTCGNYTYTELGVKGISVGTVSDCWKQ